MSPAAAEPASPRSGLGFAGVVARARVLVAAVVAVDAACFARPLPQPAARSVSRIAARGIAHLIPGLFHAPLRRAYDVDAERLLNAWRAQVRRARVHVPFMSRRHHGVISLTLSRGAAIRTAAIVVLLVVPAVIAGTAPNALRALGRGFSGLAGADPRLLGLAAAAFVAAALASASAWYSALSACGFQAERTSLTARYAVGSLVSSFTPAPTGGAVRIALVSRLLPADGSPLTVAGGCGAIAIVRGFLNAVLFLVAAAVASRGLAVPGLILLVSAGTATWLFARLRMGGRFAQLAQVATALARCPRSALIVIGWVAIGIAGRVAAVALTAAAVGVESPLPAAMIAVPALAVATLVPLLPGNLGITSAAVTLVLRERQVPLAPALSTGIAVHAVETLAGIAFGAGGLIVLAGPGLRRRLAYSAALPAAVLLAAAVGLWAGDLT